MENKRVYGLNAFFLLMFPLFLNIPHSNNTILVQVFFRKGCHILTWVCDFTNNEKTNKTKTESLYVNFYCFYTVKVCKKKERKEKRTWHMVALFWRKWVFSSCDLMNMSFKRMGISCSHNGFMPYNNDKEETKHLFLKLLFCQDLFSKVYEMSLISLSIFPFFHSERKLSFSFTYIDCQLWQFS